MDDRIWTHPQFLVSDVCKITGITPKALEHFVSPKRDLVRLIGPHVNPGKGRRRIFSGGQVLMIAAAYAMTSIGFPQRKVRVITDIVFDRAMLREKDISNDQSNFMIGAIPVGDDWRVVLLHNETVDRSTLPVSIQSLDVDRLIDQVKAQLFPL
jgi:DNA-binding transcriptional MerR regulator